MDIKVKLNNLRTAPRKVRLVADLVRNKDVAKARSLLEFAVKKPSDPLLKLLNSAVAGAVNDLKLRETNLYIAKITVDEGPKLKRWHPMSRGRAYPIMKRTSNITLVLSEKNGIKDAKVTKETKEKTENKEQKAGNKEKEEKVSIKKQKVKNRKQKK